MTFSCCLILCDVLQNLCVFAQASTPENMAVFLDIYICIYWRAYVINKLSAQIVHSEPMPGAELINRSGGHLMDICAVGLVPFLHGVILSPTLPHLWMCTKTQVAIQIIMFICSFSHSNTRFSHQLIQLLFNAGKLDSQLKNKEISCSDCENTKRKGTTR